MLKQVFPLVITFLISQTVLFSQNYLIDQLNTLISGIETIETGKAVISQSVNINNDAPYFIEFVRETEDLKKGNVKTEVYKLNIALLDVKTIKRNTKKDEMSISISSRNGKLILYSKDDDKQQYVSQLKIICPDIDAARDCEKQLKEITSMAEESWNASINIPANLSELKSRYKESDDRLQYGDTEIDQRFVDIEGYPDYFSMKQIYTKGGKEELNSYEFSIADLDKNSFKISNEKELIGLSFKTSGNKNFVQHQTEDKMKYKSAIKFYYSSPSDAMIAKELWIAGIDLAKSESEKRYNKYKNCTDCQTQLYSLIASSSKSLKPLEGSGDCLATINMTDLNKGDDKKYAFHWGDIDSNEAKIDYSGSAQMIVLPTIQKHKYIATYNKEGLEKYESTIKLGIQNVDHAKICNLLIEKIIDQCEHRIEAKTAEWLSDHLKSSEIIDRYTQAFSKDEDDCSYNFTIYDNEKGEEENYEFNLYDLNEKAMDLRISGNRITLKIPSMRNEKVITKYDVKGDLKYEKSFEILFNDLEASRTAVPTLQKAIAGCK